MLCSKYKVSITERRPQRKKEKSRVEARRGPGRLCAQGDSS